jgi:hypothetical protein
LQQIPHNFPHFPPTDILERTYHRKKDEIKDKTKKQNDKKSKKVSFEIDSSSQIVKKESENSQKYSPLSSAAIGSSFWTILGGGGRSA